eukprot:881607-Prymnesium_polylepis.1
MNGPTVAGTVSIGPHLTAGLVEVCAVCGSPGWLARYTSIGDRCCWQQSYLLYTCTSLTLDPAGSCADTQGEVEGKSVMQKFHPPALLVMPSMHFEAEKSWPGMVYVDSMEALRGVRISGLPTSAVASGA